MYKRLYSGYSFWHNGKENRIMKKIQIFGTGCPKCEELFELTKRVADAIGLECEIEKITDIDAMLEAGIMITPALAVDGKVKISGKIPSHEELQSLLS